MDQKTLLLLIKQISIINLQRSKVVHDFTCQVQTHKHVLFVNKNLLQAISEKQLWDKNIVVKSLLDFLQLLFIVNHQIIPSYMEALYVLRSCPDCRSGEEGGHSLSQLTLLPAVFLGQPKQGRKTLPLLTLPNPPAVSPGPHSRCCTPWHITTNSNRIQLGPLKVIK